MDKFVIKGGKPLKGEVTISGAKNAALLAIQILAVSDPELAGKLDAMKRRMADEVIAKDRKLQEQL